MALEHALLAALDERSGSGYELARRFDKSIGFFHSATHQQIYRVLRRMEDHGWVTGRTVPQDGRPDKKVYRVSAAGRTELDRWIAHPSDPEQLRSDLAVKIRAAGPGTLPALLAELTRHRDAHAARLEVYRTIEKRDFPAPHRLTGPSLHQYLVLRGGIRVEQGFADWCQEVLDALTTEDHS
ncbi:PadR family transcriptional regulator [Rhodococcus aetherivorans]|uniref:PadR family transcriptional regulator n=1 Tax=Rhodococcus TaxID=1827 RepID=UPI000622D1E8|nr:MULTISPECIES: PadR family transcriptional regulator [Rhodococcus]AKE89597.1 PadR family transcriptional regulator [Rhodococcus aetherivorans]OLL17315.1 PadR family transcriptional regulator [Rhodococcus sp. M8]PND51190.1 PadR family transcriptional regulator [Rhodococcus sp. ENV425]QPG45581.1 PadR family transcriptional regulator [Rhodococcus sp. M8]USC17469.1 PadR family transcriptional regulator [Rhodococcus sp. 11-3]